MKTFLLFSLAILLGVNSVTTAHAEGCLYGAIAPGGHYTKNFARASTAGLRDSCFLAAQDCRNFVGSASTFGMWCEPIDAVSIADWRLTHQRAVAPAQTYRSVPLRFTCTYEAGNRRYAFFENTSAKACEAAFHACTKTNGAASCRFANLAQPVSSRTMQFGCGGTDYGSAHSCSEGGVEPDQGCTYPTTHTDCYPTPYDDGTFTCLSVSSCD
jgi:hypothetical protein